MLDKFQEKFCNDSELNLRLLAPAGSGKTLSLIYRCNHIYNAKGGAAKFLIVTFTRAARDELRERLCRKEFEGVAKAITVATLNSLGHKEIMKRRGEDSFTLNTHPGALYRLGSDLLRPVIRKHKQIGKAIEGNRRDIYKKLVSVIDDTKSLGFVAKKMISLQSFEEHVDWLESSGCARSFQKLRKDLISIGIIGDDEEIKSIYKKYFSFWRDAIAHLHGMGQATLEDQKYLYAEHLEDNIQERRLPVGGSRYTDILVDEFQDVNPLDLRLIQALASYNRANLTLVGDDDQAIYEWRGATPDFILHPEKAFDRKFTTHILENNYRCPKNIVEHSKKLISHNINRVSKNIIAKSKFTADIKIIEGKDLLDTIETVGRLVEEFIDECKKKGEGKRAVLISRKKAQLIPYQILFASKDLPFCAAEDLQVFLTESFKDLITVVGYRADINNRRTAAQYADIALEFIDRVWKFPLKVAEKRRLKTYLVGERPRSWEQLYEALVQYQGPIKDKEGDEVVEYMEKIVDSVKSFLSSKTVSGALDILSDDQKFRGFQRDYGRSQEEIFFADPPFLYLSQFAERYREDFTKFLEDVEAAKENLAQTPNNADEDADPQWRRPIHLVTAFRAKGREFDHVILLDVNSGIWPSSQATTASELEAERRLFYVAMTRAKERLIFTISNKIGNAPAMRSPYILESGFE